MDPKSQFNSPDLQKVCQQIEPILSQHKQQLDQISADIKEVERFLRGCGIRFPSRLACSDLIRTVEEDPLDQSSRQIRVLDYIGWGKSKDGQFRLLYESEEQMMTCRDGVYQTQKAHLPVECRPLIEAKVRVRLELYPILPKFLEEIAKTLQPMQTQVAHQEITTSLENIKNGKKG